MSIAIGKERGHPVTKLKKVQRPSTMKGKQSKSAKISRDLVEEMLGFSPYQKRILELHKIGKEKRAKKFAKKKVGSLVRGKRLNEKMASYLRAAKRK